MEKDFQRWHTKKAELQKKSELVLFRERDVWWCAIGENLGDEQDGKGESFARPIIVLRKFTATIFWALPLTTKQKIGTYYYRLSSVAGKGATVTLNQLRLIDGRRLIKKIDVVPADDFEAIKKAVSDFLH